MVRGEGRKRGRRRRGRTRKISAQPGGKRKEGKGNSEEIEIREKNRSFMFGMLQA